MLVVEPDGVVAVTLNVAVLPTHGVGAEPVTLTICTEPWAPVAVPLASSAPVVVSCSATFGTVAGVTTTLALLAPAIATAVPVGIGLSFTSFSCSGKILASL